MFQANLGAQIPSFEIASEINNLEEVFRDCNLNMSYLEQLKIENEAKVKLMKATLNVFDINPLLNKISFEPSTFKVDTATLGKLNQCSHVEDIEIESFPTLNVSRSSSSSSSYSFSPMLG